jgi:hypothetical protein
MLFRVDPGPDAKAYRLIDADGVRYIKVVQKPLNHPREGGGVVFVREPGSGGWKLIFWPLNAKN